MKVRLGLAVCLLIIRVSPVLAAGDATGINKIQHIIIIVQ